jgi:hypothetical protein
MRELFIRFQYSPYYVSVRAPPPLVCGVIDGRGIREDMVGEVIALQGEHNLTTLVCIDCRRRIHNS